MIILTAALAWSAWGQYYPDLRTQKRDGDLSNRPTPGFTGIVRGSDKKGLAVENVDKNVLQFTCTRKTVYLQGKTRLKLADIQAGDTVTVEARKAPDGTLDAVVVHLERRAKRPGTIPDA
ncbi:MAG: hypothetical protein HY858_06530 [Candidatus Solibacter usitatus]|nr:hypothetical protein [Candidatus Solibacter usitatus]